jgi:cytidine deaminase
MRDSSARYAELVQLALNAQKWAYAPYSDYAVGAALLSTSGEIYDGVNVENAVFPLTICAERSAVVKAVSAGEREFEAIAVATDNGGTPCGACRQVLAEFGLDIAVIIVDRTGEITLETTVGALLPHTFTANDLPIPEASEKKS